MNMTVTMNISGCKYFEENNSITHIEIQERKRNNKSGKLETFNVVLMNNSEKLDTSFLKNIEGKYISIINLKYRNKVFYARLKDIKIIGEKKNDT